MRAAVLRGADPIGMEDMTLDEPRAGEVLVKVVACGVCHSDLHTINRAKSAALPAPVILGHEVGGIVEAVGPGVTSVVEGDHVVVAFKPNCGQCYFCVRGQPQLCERSDYPDRLFNGSNPRLRDEGGNPVQQGIGVGGYAQYTVMPERGVVKVREDAPLDRICLVGCGVTTGVGAALRTAQVEAGSDVLGIDWRVDPAQAIERVGDRVALQGNLDPAVLFAPPQTVAREAQAVLDRFGAPQRTDGGWDGHIFNLGHGIQQLTPPEHVSALVEAVHTHSRRLRGADAARASK